MAKLATLKKKFENTRIGLIVGLVLAIGAAIGTLTPFVDLSKGMLASIFPEEWDPSVGGALSVTFPTIVPL